jgi:hypothetical protein
MYGLGSVWNETSGGAWIWRRPGGGWSVNSGFGYSRFSGPALYNTSSWYGRAGLVKELNAHLSASAVYAYIRYPSTLLYRADALSQNGVQVALYWSPSARR